MELCDGPVLAFIPPPAKEVERRLFIKTVIRQLLSCLVYLSSLHVAHHDIKPDNILLLLHHPQNDAPFTVKLCDFGIAERYDPSLGCTNFFGSPAYQSPEIVTSSEGRPFDGSKADVWAVGVSLYQMVFEGRLPFTGDSVYLTMKAIESEPLSFPPLPQYTLRDSLFLRNDDRLLLDLLRLLLEKDPTKRPSPSHALAHRWFSLYPHSTSMDSGMSSLGSSCCSMQ